MLHKAVEWGMIATNPASAVKRVTIKIPIVMAFDDDPPREAVAGLTKEVLSRPGLKACWVVGGIANFTDIFETMSGFVDGIRQTHPKPDYPFVIRRDGPRQKEQKEAAAMLKEFAKTEGFEFYTYDARTSMVETAKIVVELAYENKIPKNGYLG